MHDGSNVKILIWHLASSCCTLLFALGVYTLVYKHCLGVDAGKCAVRVLLSHAGMSAVAGKNPSGNHLSLSD